MVEGEDRERFDEPKAVRNAYTCHFRLYHPVRHHARSQSVADDSDDLQTHHGFLAPELAHPSSPSA